MFEFGNKIKLFAFDLDGTLCLGENLIEGAIDLHCFLKKEFIIVFFTNNSTKTRKEIYYKLKTWGFECELEDIFTYRKNIKFRTQNNPFDLSRVMGNESNFGKKTKIWVSSIVNRPDGSPVAIISFKDQTMKIVKGDSIDGGVIENITTTEVTYRKNEKIQTWDLGVGNNID